MYLLAETTGLLRKLGFECIASLVVVRCTLYLSIDPICLLCFGLGCLTSKITLQVYSRAYVPICTSCRVCLPMCIDTPFVPRVHGLQHTLRAVRLGLDSPNPLGGARVCPFDGLNPPICIGTHLLNNRAKGPPLRPRGGAPSCFAGTPHPLFYVFGGIWSYPSPFSIWFGPRE